MTDDQTGAPSQGDLGDGVRPASSSPRTRPPVWAWALAGVLVLVLVAGAVTAGVMWSKVRGVNGDEEQRASATAVATQFALRMDKVDGNDFTGYIKSVNQLLTTKAQAKNNQQLDVMKQTYQAAKIKGLGKVLLTGITSADADSATVLVVHDANVSTTQGQLLHHYRWSVDLVMVHGRWLVDDFNPVN